MSEYIKLVTKKPALVGPNNLGLALGLLESRGEKYLVVLDVLTGNLHIVLVFAAEAMGKYLAGYKEIEDEKLWAMLTTAVSNYGLNSAAHLVYCIREMNVNTPATEAIIKQAELERKVKS